MPAKRPRTRTPSSEKAVGGKQAAPLKADIERHILSFLGNDAALASKHDYFKALAYTVRERMAERWIKTQRAYYLRGAKRVYYLSLEFLPGRSLWNNILCLGLERECVRTLEEFGVNPEDIVELEWDAGLGNGGLGRLASCYLDSMATMGIPAYGYGIRYDYGIFYQLIQDGWQLERPDNWLRFGNPWEFERPQHLYPVEFFGEVRTYYDSHNRLRHQWVSGEHVMAMACDMLVPGYQNGNVINMRLWAAKSSREFDLDFFNNGEYIKAIEHKTSSENISKVLYPSDAVAENQELRLKQQYFFVSATFQDIMRRHRKDHPSMENLHRYVAVQLNDTHPAIAIPELMRLLLDQELMDWDQAWEITRKTFAYTNHTVMPEALERWPVDLLTRVLPRHMQIIYEINHRFLEEVAAHSPGDEGRLRRMSLIEEGRNRRVRMAHLAIVGSHAVNGVSVLHSDIIRNQVFRDFSDLDPGLFQNKTNGVTPRRWLRLCNPGLSGLLAETLGPDFLTDLDRLERLAPLAADAAFRERWEDVRRRNKKRLADYVLHKVGARLDWDGLFDVQVKRIHEYKRQFLNILHVVVLLNRLRDGVPGPNVPRAHIFGGKAAPGYRVAKLIIKLINSVAERVNAEPAAQELLKVVFLPNYCVSTAERIIPGADISEQISLAGTEASGTSNMKFALNGALTVGTLDGANVEIREAVGPENFFHFGLDAVEVSEVKARGHNPWEHYSRDPELKRAIDMIAGGHFSPLEPDLFRPLVDGLLRQGDPFLVLADFRSYADCQERAARAFLRKDRWTAMSIRNTAGMGRFSSDRAVMEYARDIWGVTPQRPED
ncbi:MAG TPA: glycogen/starch/alpha-glucan phosphorylase [Desulfovibrio sp.]|jgi:starch phosphorylase|uniref:glycogen/starch/alpha-glucan phosphorylase n=1 Tax=Desulfovibrio TaxID=872 RepID=UPI002B6C3930|nr:glycogen/starch/alpha-glucan phosphorylase [Desulfovibrio sp.]HMM39402.1 glycogen/starch/alpha-glucan phosphorylase [Desulfovibrio sp.]